MEEKETYDNLIRVDDAYCRGKRDPLWRKKRPTIEEKEKYDNLIWVDDAYCRGKRDHLL